MKKIISFVLAAVLLVSAVPTALATNDYSQGTQVVYEATGNESYTITVPAQLAPGGSGTVTLEGTWADNRIVTVTADPTVTLTNSIKAEDQKVLNVHFDGISEAGSNIGSQTFTEGVSVDDITNALFGTWSGKFNYNASINTSTAVMSGSTLRMDDVSDVPHNLKIQLTSDTITDFSNVTVTKTGKNLLDVTDLVANYAAENLTYDSSTNSISFSKKREEGVPCNVETTMWLPAGTYTFSCDVVSSDGFSSSSPIVVRDTATLTKITPSPSPMSPFCTFTVTTAQEYQVMLMMNALAPLGTEISLSNVQLEYGSTKTAFEPYSAQTVTANADGSVSGLTSVSPSMTIFTDADVEINCEYQKKN